ncbi:MAG TPA: hypothetical protein VHV50_07205, partial [Actinomycetota bacterium]|nr:hypothetical protein [Actinomycetota bacterium]
MAQRDLYRLEIVGQSFSFSARFTPLGEAPHYTSIVTDLRGMINGYRVSQALYVAATLGIADY